jgi:hypothetical protein
MPEFRSTGQERARAWARFAEKIGEFRAKARFGRVEAQMLSIRRAAGQRPLGMR